MASLVGDTEGVGGVGQVDVADAGSPDQLGVGRPDHPGGHRFGQHQVGVAPRPGRGGGDRLGAHPGLLGQLGSQQPLGAVRASQHNRDARRARPGWQVATAAKNAARVSASMSTRLPGQAWTSGQVARRRPGRSTPARPTVHAPPWAWERATSWPTMASRTENGVGGVQQAALQLAERDRPFGNPAMGVVSRASGRGPVTRRSKVFSKVSNGESVRARRGVMATPSRRDRAAIRPWGLPRFDPESTPLLLTPRYPTSGVPAGSIARPKRVMAAQGSGVPPTPQWGTRLQTPP